MGDKEDNEGPGALDAVKAVRWFYMVFKGSVESFDKLLVGSVGLGLTVEILEPDDLSMLQQWIVYSFGIEKVDSGGIRGVAIGHKDNGLIWICGANCFSHGNNGRESFSGVCHMVGRDLEVLGRDEEEHVVMFAHDFDVCLIPGVDRINGSFMLKVKAMAIEGGGSRIVQYGLIGDRDGEHRPEHEGRLSCAQGERDVKSQDEAKNIGSVVDGPQIDGRLFGFR